MIESMNSSYQVRLVQAVDHPTLRSINVVAFSQKGSRDLPNMLAGSDLVRRRSRR